MVTGFQQTHTPTGNACPCPVASGLVPQSRPGFHRHNCYWHRADGSWPPGGTCDIGAAPTCASATTALRSFSMREGRNSGSKATSVRASSTCRPEDGHRTCRRGRAARSCSDSGPPPEVHGGCSACTGRRQGRHNTAVDARQPRAAHPPATAWAGRCCHCGLASARGTRCGGSRCRRWTCAWRHGNNGHSPAGVRLQPPRLLADQRLSQSSRRLPAQPILVNAMKGPHAAAAAAGAPATAVAAHAQGFRLGRGVRAVCVLTARPCPAGPRASCCPGR